MRQLNAGVPPQVQAESDRVAKLEQQLGEVQAALPLPRVGIHCELWSDVRGKDSGFSWTIAGTGRVSDVVGDWGVDTESSWLTVPRTGVYTISVTYVLICGEPGGAYNIVVFSVDPDTGANEKLKVTEGRASGAVGGTAAGLMPLKKGEKLRVGFRAPDGASLYGGGLNHWTIRQEAD